MKNELIVGLGEIVWDMFPGYRVLGGGPANFAYHLTQFGYAGYVVSAVGADPAGHEIREALSEMHLRHHLATVDYPTGLVEVTLSDTIPSYNIRENSAWDNIPFTGTIEQIARQTRAVSFGSLAQRHSVSRSTIHRFLDAMLPGSLKIFDINLRQHYYTAAVIRDSLLRADVLKMNEEELAVLSSLFALKSTNEKEACLLLLREYGLQLVILTKGTDGSSIFSSQATSQLPTPKVEAIDTVGAGDSFTAAFIAAYLQGKSIAEAHRLAVDVAAYVATQSGAMPKLPGEYTEGFSLNDPF